jgi:hypothetical protein
MSFASTAAQRVTSPDYDDQRSATKQMMHDFLDHFRFAAERLQNAVRAPAQTFELVDWRPVSLTTHMKAYGHAVYDGYEQLSDDFRALFEEVAHELDTKGTAALVAIRRQHRRPLMGELDFADFCTKAGLGLSETLRRAELVLHPMRAVPRAPRPQLEVLTNVLMG